ncbi:armadillo-type protein [Parasitella parasitica]|nr:armadillo-type protein [Parasitella parasitica]
MMADLGVYTTQENQGSTTEGPISSTIVDDTVATIPVIVIHEQEDNDVAVLKDNHDGNDQDIVNVFTASDGEQPPPYTEQDNYFNASELLVDKEKNENLVELDEQVEKQREKDEEYDLLLDLQQSSEEQIQQQQAAEEESLLTTLPLPPLEKLIKFSSSTLVLQRLVVTRNISAIIYEISAQEAVDTVLPIVIQLSKDTEDAVKEALASELDKIMYYYYENAPPVLDSVTYPDAVCSHIPKNAFAETIIEFLLDQNTTLASITQQSVVTIAAELAETAEGSEKYALHQMLLNAEIFQGIVLGLINIFSGRQQQQNVNESDDEQQPQDAKPIEISDANDKENIINTPVPDAPASTTVNNTTTAVVEKKPPENIANNVALAATSALTKNYDHGGVNLAKMVCLMLMSALAPVFGPEGCTEKILPIVESLVSDPMFYVRKETAAAVGSLSTIVPAAVTLEKLLPIYLKLSVDTIWHVRRSCVFALPLLCEALPHDMKSTIAVEGVELFKNDVSRNVRNSLADVTGEVISKFLPEDWKETGNPGQVPEELLGFFLSLGNATTSSANQMYKVDTERIHNCAYNFPAVVLTAGVGYWDSHLKDTYLNLTKDYQLKVRRTFAYSLHDIARIIGPERTERDLVQIFALYLMDLDDVKQGVLEHLSEFLSVLAVSSRNEYIPILAEVWDGVMNNWHLRDILTNQLRDISRLFDASRVVEHILPLAIKACHDEFASVRETGVEIFPVILDIVKRTVDEDGENLSHVGGEGDVDETDTLFERQQKYALALLNHVMEKLDDLVRSEAYHTRLVFTQICRSLLDAGINPADFASFFLPRLALLVKDPVVNVRIAASRTIHTLCLIDAYKEDIENVIYADEIAMEGESSPKQILSDIFYHLATDKDKDVRFYILDLISLEELELYQKKKAVEDLQVAEEPVAKTQSSPPPPPPSAHVIMQPSVIEYPGIPTVHQVLADREEQRDQQRLQEHADEVNQDPSADSPMEIIEDYQYCPGDSDEVMTDIDDILEPEVHHQLEADEKHDDIPKGKAQHISLSKTPIRALNDANMAPHTSSALSATAVTSTAAASAATFD